MSDQDEAREVQRLAREVEELKRRNEELEHEVEPHPRYLARRIGAIVLIVIAGVLAPISTMGLWMRSQVTNTDKYVRTVSPLVSDPAIQNLVADRVTQRLFEEVDVQATIQEALPERASFLSGALTSGLQTLVRDATLRLVESDKFAELWTSANRLAHEQMVAVLTGSKSNAISTKDGDVTLDLSGVANEVVSQLKARGIDTFDSVNLQPGRFTIQIFHSDAITRVQLAFKVFNTTAIVLPFLTILLFVGGILLFPNRRRGALWAAVALSVGMAVLLLALAIGRTIYLGAVPSSVMPQDAASAFFDTLIRFLRQSARALLAVGIIGLLLCIGFGPGSGATRFRGWVARLLGRVGDEASDRGVDFGPVGRWVASNLTALRIGIAVLAAILLIAWDQPTAFVVFVVALLALLILGVVGGRRPRRALVAAGLDRFRRIGDLTKKPSPNGTNRRNSRPVTSRAAPRVVGAALDGPRQANGGSDHRDFTGVVKGHPASGRWWS